MNTKPYNLQNLTKEKLIQLKNEVEEMLNRPVLRTVREIQKDLPSHVCVYSTDSFLNSNECLVQEGLDYSNEFLNEKEALSAIAYQKLCLIINDANSKEESHKSMCFSLFNGKIQNDAYFHTNRPNPLPPTTEDIAEQILKSDYHLNLLKQYFMID